tara:strand:+ start:24 stop:833 length:810 start_codon:yes stop_codon:yes gene_type:complete
MGEFGCLGDEYLQTLKVEGKIKVDILESGTTQVGTLNVLGPTTFADGVTVGATENLTLTEGDLLLTKGDLTLTEGNLGLTLGNLTLTNGDLILTDGNVLAPPHLPTLVELDDVAIRATVNLTQTGGAGTIADNGAIVIFSFAGDAAGIIQLPNAIRGHSILLIQATQHNHGNAQPLTIKPTGLHKFSKGSFIHTNVERGIWQAANGGAPVNRFAAAGTANSIVITGALNDSISGLGSTFRFHCLVAGEWFAMAECQADGDGTAGNIAFV